MKRKKNVKLYIINLCKRSLKAEEGDIESTELRCFFKPKVGSSSVEDTPNHLPDICKIYDINDNLINVLPFCGKKWDIPDYHSIFHHF